MWVVFAMAEGETYLGYPFPRVSATFVMLTVWAMFIVGIQEATMNFYRREPPPPSLYRYRGVYWSGGNRPSSSDSSLGME